ncbi:Os03g0823600 [Oryza sativa Japonica Group]|uniref:Os03g0823600 protein n=1 Tax=Oryza sativa subsp. japonica TaxID=39947 RepID=A0A0P0W5H5_ORYSJ|nr:Os03g0823600 [Oryza sativa Japonica Group]
MGIKGWLSEEVPGQRRAEEAEVEALGDRGGGARVGRLGRARGRCSQRGGGPEQDEDSGWWRSSSGARVVLAREMWPRAVAAAERGDDLVRRRRGERGS